MTIDKALRYLDSVRDADPLMGEIHDAVRATMRRHSEEIARLVADVKESGRRIQREMADHEDTKKRVDFWRTKASSLEIEYERLQSRLFVCEKDRGGVRASIVTVEDPKT